MRSVGRICLFLVGILSLVSSASSQGRSRFFFNSDARLTPEIDREVQQSLEEAFSLIQEKQYAPAVLRLQSVLIHPEDYFVEKDFRSPTQSGVKTAALRALAKLPPAGRDAYELLVGNEAKSLLKEALATSDFDKLLRVVADYQMTNAGFEALQQLAARALDRNEPIQAGLIGEAMLEHPASRGPIQIPLLLQTAFSWHLAGQPERCAKVMELLAAAKDTGPWQVGGRAITPFVDLNAAPDWMQTHFGPVRKRTVSFVDNWELPRGGETGNESSAAASPVGGGAWSISPREHLRFQTDPQLNQQRIDAFDQIVHQVERMMHENNRLTQPAPVPLIIGEIVVYRTINDITAINLRTGQLVWRSSKTDGMLTWLFQSPLASSDAISSSSPLTFRGYLRFKLFRDQLSGSLSSDGKLVYAVEESESQFSLLLPRSRLPFGAQMIMDPVNKLAAYEVKGGRLIWEVGGQNDTPPSDLSGFFFVGPPLPHEGRLYCLAESKSELRLLSLIPEEASARLEWSQALVATDRTLIGASFRMAGLVPVTAEGLIICPTANGAVVAFDLVQRQLRWGYSYDSRSRRNAQGGADLTGDEEEGRWIDGGPVISGDRVLFTPRDSNEIHCINLIDGSLNWKRSRQQGLYIACVHGDHVVVVGQNQVSAYSLSDGADAWKQPAEIPEPAGRGIHAGHQYLLPLSTGEIATFDLATGHILGRSKLPQNRLPGNLAVGEGTLVSCGIHDVIGFRSLFEVEEQIAHQLRSNPLDAEALALRGELRLHRGQEVEAINDLRMSLRQRSQPAVKRVLAETLLNRMRDDPRQILQASAELEQLTDDPRQKLEFLRLYAASLNEAGDRVGAMTQLFKLALSMPIPEEMIAVGLSHFVSLEQHIRSQLFTISAAADALEQTEIARLFQREFVDLQGASDRDQRLARFVNLTMGHPASDRLLLSVAQSKDPLPAGISRVDVLERLRKSNNRPIAAAATALLVVHALDVGDLQTALIWIGELGLQFPDEVCLDGKTGRQLSDEWSARNDVRDARSIKANWPEGPIKVVRSEQNMSQATFPVDVVTQTGGFFDGWTFETDALVTTLTARDQNFKIVWRMPLMNSADDLRINPSQLYIRGRRLALASGMWLGVMEVTDMRTVPRLIYEQSLRPNSFVASRSNSIPVERRLLPNGHRVQLISDGRGIAGFVVGLSDDAVVYQLDNRLYAVDPGTGKQLWTRVGTAFGKVDGTVDERLMLATVDNGAQILRMLDGSLEQQHKGNPHEVPLWFQGTRRLSQRNLGTDQRVFEMRDFDGDRVIWQSQHPAGSMPSLVSGGDLAILEPNSKLTVLKLDNGEKRFESELPLKRPLRGILVFSVQPEHDRFLVVAGVSPRRTEIRRVEPLNYGFPREFGPIRELGAPSSVAFAVDGIVASVDRTDGAVKWSVPVNELAFDTSQPANLPVVVLAAWLIDTDLNTGFPRDPKLSTLMIDKRSGEKLYEQQESATPVGRGVQFTPMLDARKLLVDFYNFQLELLFPPKTSP